MKSILFFFLLALCFNAGAQDKMPNSFDPIEVDDRQIHIDTTGYSHPFFGYIEERSYNDTSFGERYYAVGDSAGEVFRYYISTDEMIIVDSLRCIKQMYALLRDHMFKRERREY